MTEAQPPGAMKKLVLVIIGIAILGTVIALAVYYGVELPAQKNMKPPSNGCSPEQVQYYTVTCPGNCGNDIQCVADCSIRMGYCSAGPNAPSLPR